MNRLLIALALLAAAAPCRADGGAPASGRLDAELPSAYALSPDGSQELSFLLGDFHPTAKFGINNVTGDKGERFGRDGYFFAVDYFHRLLPALDLGLEGAYLSRGDYYTTNIPVIGQPPAVTRVHGDSEVVMPLLRLRAPGRAFRPYLIGGFGLHHTHLDLYTPIPYAEIPSFKGNSTGWAWTGRAGVEYAFGSGGLLGVEAGYLHIDKQNYPTTTNHLGGQQAVSTPGDGYVFAAKFGVRFGGGS